MENKWEEDNGKEENNVIEKVEREIDRIQKHQIIKLPIWEQ